MQQRDCVSFKQKTFKKKQTNKQTNKQTKITKKKQQQQQQTNYVCISEYDEN